MKPFQFEGCLAWLDLKTPRIDTAKTFYGDLFGWRFKEELLPGRVMTKMFSTESEGAVQSGQRLAMIGHPVCSIYRQKVEQSALSMMLNSIIFSSNEKSTG